MESMGTTTKGSRRMVGALAGIALLGLCLAAPPAHAGTVSATEAAGAARIVGVWRVTVTLRNCDTDAPLGPPFQSLVTFDRDGHVRETAGTLAFAPNQRTDGHGTWRQTGVGTFRQRTINLVRFTTDPQPPAPGFQAGWQVIDQSVTLVDKDHFSSEGGVMFYDAQGDLYRSGCSTAEGVRFR